MRFVIDVPAFDSEGDLREARAGLAEGFMDGTTDWAEEDVADPWRLLDALKDAKEAT